METQEGVGKGLLGKLTAGAAPEPPAGQEEVAGLKTSYCVCLPPWHHHTSPPSSCHNLKNKTEQLQGEQDFLLPCRTETLSCPSPSSPHISSEPASLELQVHFYHIPCGNSLFTQSKKSLSFTLDAGLTRID